MMFLDRKLAFLDDENVELKKWENFHFLLRDHGFGKKFPFCYPVFFKSNRPIKSLS